MLLLEFSSEPDYALSQRENSNWLTSEEFSVGNERLQYLSGGL